VIAVSEQAKANGAVREDLKDLTEDVVAHFIGRKPMSAAIADFDGRLDQIQNDLDILKKAENQKEPENQKEAKSQKGGFWHRVLQIPDEDPDRARERTRARIAYALIGALVVAIAATFLYVVTLSAGNLSPEEIINVTHGLGTTLLAPLVGLIGAVIGFYYGGQTAVQGAQQATVASQKHAEATQEATQAATQTAKEATQAATQTAKEATQAATQTAKEATQAATQVATQATQTANEATQVAKEATQARQ
jgi:hypothetical protein